MPPRNRPWRRTKTKAQGLNSPQTRLENFRASDFLDTNSWQSHRLLQIQAQLVWKSPLRVVRNRRFNGARLVIGIDIKQQRTNQVLEIIDHHFLLLRVI